MMLYMFNDILLQVEELIAVLHSKIVHLSVYNHKNCERIVVLSDDGYIRLLCSSTGQCLTIVFPIVSAHVSYITSEKLKI